MQKFSFALAFLTCLPVAVQASVSDEKIDFLRWEGASATNLRTMSSHDGALVDQLREILGILEPAPALSAPNPSEVAHEALSLVDEFRVLLSDKDRKLEEATRALARERRRSREADDRVTIQADVRLMRQLRVNREQRAENERLRAENESLKQRVAELEAQAKPTIADAPSASPSASSIAPSTESIDVAAFDVTPLRPDSSSPVADRSPVASRPVDPAPAPTDIEESWAPVEPRVPVAENAARSDEGVKPLPGTPAAKDSPPHSDLGIKRTERQLELEVVRLMREVVSRLLEEIEDLRSSLPNP